MFTSNEEQCKTWAVFLQTDFLQVLTGNQETISDSLVFLPMLSNGKREVSCPTESTANSLLDLERS